MRRRLPRGTTLNSVLLGKKQARQCCHLLCAHETRANDQEPDLTVLILPDRAYRTKCEAANRTHTPHLNPLGKLM